MIGRWGRARRWLSPSAGRVLDVGCAFGFGTAVIAGGGGEGRWVAGLESDPHALRDARRRYPWLPLAQAGAAALPVRAGAADAVVLLDVLEHVAGLAAVVAEARRVLPAGGQLLVSVPYAGPLARLDALNCYAALRRRLPALPPLSPDESSAGGTHRHFSTEQLVELLAPRFTLVRSRRTGLGLAELVHLPILLLCRGLLRAERVYLALRYLAYTVYLLEDLLPTGPAGFHVTVEARAT